MMCERFDLGCWLSSFLSELSEFFQRLFLNIVMGLISIIDLLPLPFSSSDITAAVNNLPNSLFYWFDLFELQMGVTIIVSSYIVRFIIRRLPVIG